MVLEELVELCGRVIVLTERPARIKAIVDIDMQRPRNRRSGEFY